jgi:hypothetical protein
MQGLGRSLYALAACILLLGVVTILQDTADETIEMVAAPNQNGFATSTSTTSHNTEGVTRLKKFMAKVEEKLAKEASERKAGQVRIEGLVRKNQALAKQNAAFAHSIMQKHTQALKQHFAVNMKGAHASVVKAMRHAQTIVANIKSYKKRNGNTIIVRNSKAFRALLEARRKAVAQVARAVAVWTHAMNADAISKHNKIISSDPHLSANKVQIDQDSSVVQRGVDKLLKGWFKKTIKGHGTRHGIFTVSAKVSSAAVQFQKMLRRHAAQRYDMDQQLMRASVRLQACFNAVEALKDHTFAKKLGGPRSKQKARDFAKNLLIKAKMEFKVSIASLVAVVTQQTEDNEVRKGEASSLMPSSKMVQSKAEHVSSSELKRMIHIANARYSTMKRHDPELKKLISESKAATPHRLLSIANSFYMHLTALNKSMKHNYVKAANRLTSSTAGLYSALAARYFAQKRGVAVADTVPATVKASVVVSKKQFNDSLHAMTKVAMKTEKKYRASMAKLTGFRKSEAASSLIGRQMLRLQAIANRARIKSLILNAVRRGEKLGLQSLRMKKRPNTGKAHLRVSTDINALRRRFMKTLKALEQTSGPARSQVHKEMLFALKAATARSSTNMANACKRALASRGAAKHSGALTQSIMAHQRLVLATQLLSNKEAHSSDRAHAASRVRYARSSLDATVGGMMSVIASAAKDKKTLHNIKATAYAARKRAHARFIVPFLKLSEAYAHTAKAFEVASVHLGQQEWRLASVRAASKPSAHSVKAASAAQKAARQRFTKAIHAFTSASRQIEFRVLGEAAVLTGLLTSGWRHRALVARRVTRSMARALKLAVRGLMRMNAPKSAMKYRKVAIDKVLMLARNAKHTLDKIRSKASAKWRGAERRLQRATRNLFTQMCASRRGSASRSGLPRGEDMSVSAAKRMKSAMTALVFEAVASTSRTVEALRKAKILARGVSGASQIPRAWSTKRALMADMQSAVTLALQVGEAQAKAKAERSPQRGNPLLEIRQQAVSMRVERRAEEWWRKMEATRRVVARNYLQLKAYVSVAHKMAFALMSKSDVGLMSLGDLMMALHQRVKAHPKAAVGMGMGSKKLAPLLSGSHTVLRDTVGNINGVVNEYSIVMASLRGRWKMGIGHYVLDQLDQSMHKRGVLRVRRALGAADLPKKVTISPQAVGLEDQLEVLKTYAVNFDTFQSALRKSAHKVSSKSKMALRFMAPPPQWQGN